MTTIYKSPPPPGINNLQDVWDVGEGECNVMMESVKGITVCMSWLVDTVETRMFSCEPSGEVTVIKTLHKFGDLMFVGQAQGLCLSAWSGVSVQASAMLSMFISLQILKMNFTETATIVFNVPEQSKD